MSSFVIFGLSGDPLNNTTLNVVADYRVDITDDDASLEDPDQNGTAQFDTNGLPGTINSANLQVFEEYGGFVNGQPVGFTLIRFSGQDLVVLTSGTMANGDVVTGITLVTFNGAPVDYADLPTFICFASGSLIATPDGDRKVEELRAGDDVLTADNGPQKVGFVASRRLGPRDLAAAAHLRPCVIPAGALGGGLPLRDLIVSPQHRMLVSGARLQVCFGETEALIPAKAMPCARQTAGMRSVSYHHLLFERHQVIWANGAATESLHAGPEALTSIRNDARSELLELFPDIAADAGVATARPILRPFEAAALYEP